MKYDIPIRSPEHAEFCRREAERRYDGIIVISRDGTVTVKDANGFHHTDEVLRSLTNLHRRGRLP